MKHYFVLHLIVWLWLDFGLFWDLFLSAIIFIVLFLCNA